MPALSEKDVSLGTAMHGGLPLPVSASHYLIKLLMFISRRARRVRNHVSLFAKYAYIIQAEYAQGRDCEAAHGGFYQGVGDVVVEGHCRVVGQDARL